MTSLSRACLLVLALAVGFLGRGSAFLGGGGWPQPRFSTTRLSSASSPSSEGRRPRGAGCTKVKVDIGPYKEGAIQVKCRRADAEVSEDAVEAAVADELIKRTSPVLEPVRVAEVGGVQIGHTVIMDWKVVLRGRPPTVVHKTDVEFELTDELPEPWCTFAQNLNGDRFNGRGTGQMEMRSFTCAFPEDFEEEALAGREARTEVVVKKICQKVPPPPDTRSTEQVSEEVRALLVDAANRRVERSIQDQIRSALLESSDVDTDKIVNSVSWAKFGEKSLESFKWAAIQEEVAGREGLQDGARDAMQYLRGQVQVQWEEEI